MNKIVLSIVVLLLVFNASAVLLVMANEKEEFKRATPYEATPSEVDIKDMPKIVVYNRSYEKPDDKNISLLLQEALDRAEKVENQIRNIVAKDLVRVSYWNGEYSGAVYVRADKMYHSFVFKSSAPLLISQYSKVIYKDKFGGKDRNNEISILFYDDKDCIKSFDYENGKDSTTLSFFPDNKLAECGLIINNEKYYRAQWDENGKIINQNMRTISDAEKQENNQQ